MSQSWYFAKWRRCTISLIGQFWWEKIETGALMSWVINANCFLFTKERSRLKHFATVATPFRGFQSFLRIFLIELSNFCDLKIVIDTFGALWWARHLLEFCVNRSDACFDHLKIQQLATTKILVTDGIRKRLLHLEDTQCLAYFGNV